MGGVIDPPLDLHALASFLVLFKGGTGQRRSVTESQSRALGSAFRHGVAESTSRSTAGSHRAE